MAASSPKVVVGGAGVGGTSHAFHLARAGARVAVFDKGDICAGMSARSGALIRMHYSFPAEAELTWKSLSYFVNWREMVGGECGFTRTGFAVAVCHEDAATRRANIAAMKRLGIDTELVDPQTLKEIDPAVNVDDVVLAAHEPQSGYADPVATTRAFATASMQHHALLMLHTYVASVITRGGHATGIRDAAGRVAGADAVCIVAGPWTDALLAPLGVQIGIVGERAQIAFFKRAVAPSHLACIDTIAGSYFRPQGDTLTLAGLGEWRPEGQPNPDNFRETNDEDFIAEVGRRLGHRIIPMRGAEYAHGHAGIYDVSPDHRAVMGKVPGVSGLYVAAGFSGTGFKTSPPVGAAMAGVDLNGPRQVVHISPVNLERDLQGHPN